MPTCYKCGKELHDGTECYPSCDFQTRNENSVQIQGVFHRTTVDFSLLHHLKVDLSLVQTPDDALVLVGALKRLDISISIEPNHPEKETLKKFIKE